MEFTTIKLKEVGGDILQVTLDRPEVRNAINSVMMQELLALWQMIAEQSQWRCVILTGAGDKAFCAGADLKERMNLDTETWQQQHAVLQRAMLAMTTCEIPIIAAVNGAAFGGGLELALASDFAFAAEHATFAQSEVKLGIMPGAMGTQNLANACGLRRAKQLTFTGDRFDAQQAQRWGIVNQVLPANELLTHAEQVAQKIAANAPLAIKAAKKAINASRHLPLQEGFQVEVEAYNTLLATEDRVEGIAAFNEKRAAQFKGQ